MRLRSNRHRTTRRPRSFALQPPRIELTNEEILADLRYPGPERARPTR